MPQHLGRLVAVEDRRLFPLGHRPWASGTRLLVNLNAGDIARGSTIITRPGTSSSTWTKHGPQAGRDEHARSGAEVRKDEILKPTSTRSIHAGTGVVRAARLFRQGSRRFNRRRGLSWPAVKPPMPMRPSRVGSWPSPGNVAGLYHQEQAAAEVYQVDNWQPAGLPWFMYYFHLGVRTVYNKSEVIQGRGGLSWIMSTISGRRAHPCRQVPRPDPAWRH